MINPGLASLVGEDEKQESHHSSENSATLFQGPSSGLANSRNLHTEQEVSILFTTCSILNTMFYSLTSMCSSMLFHPLPQMKILTLFCKHPCFLQVRLMTFFSLAFPLIPKYLPVCSQKTQQTLPQEQFW